LAHIFFSCQKSKRSVQYIGIFCELKRLEFSLNCRKSGYNTIIMAKYPIFLEVGGRRVVIVGGGAVATQKAQALLAAGARLVVVSKDIDEPLSALCQGSGAELIKSKYSKNCIAEAALVIAATNDEQLNEQIYKDCQELEILCNVVDAPQLCDFIVPAVVKRGDLQVAIGTEGYCPAYAGHLRKKLEQTITIQHGEFLAELEKLRRRIVKVVPEEAERKVLLGELVDDKSFEYFVQNGADKWREYADGLVSKEGKSRL
jgi:precorrin-2 dehydrogenase/sirohydrochlorin ferrochelatase